MASQGTLSEVDAQLSKEFDLARNGGLTPDDVKAGSDKKVWWQGKCGHAWEASVGHRVRGRGCPFCSGNRVLQGFNDLFTTHPRLAEEWDLESNLPLTPSQVKAGSNKKVFWIGPCSHRFIASVAHRAQGTGCPICNGKIVIAGVNDLATTHPQIAKYWSEKNAPIASTQVHAGTPNKFWFRCLFGHEYLTAVNSKTRLNLGCPICSKKTLVRGVNDFATTHPRLASRWHPTANGSLTPSDVTSGSRISVWFICELGHEYKQVLRSSLSYGCKKCAGREVVAGENDLATLRPDLAAEWHPKFNERTPNDVMLGSDYKAWWIDELGHSWQQGVQVRSRGVGCPQCAKSGFDQSSPGVLYLIRNDFLGAKKIGITNKGVKFDRIQGFAKLGWRQVFTIECDSGQLILQTETELFRWIRKELALPEFLGKSDMGRMGGNSETFSGEAISDEELTAKMKYFFDRNSNTPD